MSGTRRWLIALVVLLVLALIGPPLVMTGMMWGRGATAGFYAMPHMLDAMPFGGWHGLGWMWLIPVGFVALAVWGLASLLGNSGRSAGQAPLSARACASCGRAAQADWSTCPYCGEPLA